MAHKYYLVQDDGDLKETNAFNAEPENVYIIVDEDGRKIWLWKGRSCPVRRKFIGSRSMSDLRKNEYGFHYQIGVVEQDDEPEEFKLSLEGKLSRGGIPGTEPQEEAMGPLYTGDDEEYRKVVGDSPPPTSRAAPVRVPGVRRPISQMGAPGVRPRGTILADPTIMQEFKKLAESKAVQDAVQVKSTEEAFQILKELGEPKGYKREMVIIGASVFKSENGEFSDLDEPLEGIYLVKDFIPRLICENGKVKAIELLKRTEGEVAEEDEIEQDLSDLIDMFGIEID